MELKIDNKIMLGTAKDIIESEKMLNADSIEISIAPMGNGKKECLIRIVVENDDDRNFQVKTGDVMNIFSDIDLNGGKEG